MLVRSLAYLLAEVFEHHVEMVSATQCLTGRFETLGRVETGADRDGEIRSQMEFEIDGEDEVGGIHFPVRRVVLIEGIARTVMRIFDLDWEFPENAVAHPLGDVAEMVTGQGLEGDHKPSCGSPLQCKRHPEGVFAELPSIVHPFRQGGDQSFHRNHAGTLDEAMDALDRGRPEESVIERLWVRICGILQLAVDAVDPVFV